MRGWPNDEFDEQTRPAKSEDETECSTDEGKQQGLSKHLADDPGPTRTERKPGGELALPRSCLGKEEIREIGASDQQHDGDNPHEDCKRSLIGFAEMGNAGAIRQQLDKITADLLTPQRRDCRSLAVDHVLLPLGVDPSL